MKKKEAAIIISSKRAARLAFKIKQELPGIELYTLGTHPQTQSAHPIHPFTAKEFDNYKYLIFIGALGICVRTIAPLLHSKTTDPPSSTSTPREGSPYPFSPATSGVPTSIPA